MTNLLTSGSNMYACLLRNLGREKKAITHTPVQHSLTSTSAVISCTHSFHSCYLSPRASICLSSSGPFISEPILILLHLLRVNFLCACLNDYSVTCFDWIQEALLSFLIEAMPRIVVLIIERRPITQLLLTP